LHPHGEARCTRRASGRKTGSILAPPFECPKKGMSSDGVEPGHTPRPRGRPKVRMLLSFQRPSHLFWKGGSFPRGALSGDRIRLRPPEADRRV
jgi:hypothetical protein